MATREPSLHESMPLARLHGRWRVVGRAAWLALTAACVGLFVATAWARYARPVVPDPNDPNQLWDALVFAVALALGFTERSYTAFAIGCDALVALTYWGVAALIVRRASGGRGPLLIAAILLIVGTIGTETFAVAIFMATSLDAVDELAVPFLMFMAFVFPDGRFVPRWAALAWLAIVPFWSLGLDSVFVAGTPLDRALPWLVRLVADWGWGIGMLVAIGLPVYAQVYRYRRVSGPRERQQTKWAVLGFAGAILIYVGMILSWFLIGPWEEANGRWFLLQELAMRLAWLLIPLALGVAILRSRLYDIDVLINRALVYTTLTLVLGLVYVGGVAALGAAFRALTGGAGRSQLTVVASTLAVAALFQPLRRRLQGAIDHRFYRRKYDAARTLADFSARLRDETDLERLGADLVAVADEAMQPAHISLWLRPPGPR